MISSEPARSTLNGYTFLEIALALGIVVVVFLAMVPLVGSSMQEKKLREAVQSVSELVMETRLASARENRRISLRMERDGLIEDLNDDTALQVAFPEGVLVTVPGPRKKWTELDGQMWYFSPIGTVTPITMRFSMEDRWIEVDFDFLTGRVAEERYAL